MCRLISHERFLSCNHTVLCHLKHPLQRCHAPDGHRFRNPDPRGEPNRAPSRSCAEEHWVSATIDTTGYCPSCREQQEYKRCLLERFSEDTDGHDDAGASAAGTVKTYACGHQRVLLWAGELQDCFESRHKTRARMRRVSDVVHQTDNSSTRGPSSYEEGVFSWRRWEELPLSCEESVDECPECRRRACLAAELLHRGLRRRKPRGLSLVVDRS
ncbi:hypothetical protein MferCBS31731_007822 [Microsporum ferrugineum]